MTDEEPLRRPGQRASNGRRGPTTRLQARAIEMAKATGALPHEILLDMARGHPQKVRTVIGKDEVTGLLEYEEEWVTLSVDDQRDAAKAAAPYYAPKLSTVETVTGMADDDLDSIIKQLAAEAGIALGASGEGQALQAGAGHAAATGAASAPPRRRVSFD